MLVPLQVSSSNFLPVLIGEKIKAAWSHTMKRPDSSINHTFSRSYLARVERISSIRSSLATVRWVPAFPRGLNERWILACRRNFSNHPLEALKGYHCHAQPSKSLLKSGFLSKIGVAIEHTRWNLWTLPQTQGKSLERTCTSAGSSFFFISSKPARFTQIQPMSRQETMQIRPSSDRFCLRFWWTAKRDLTSQFQVLPLNSISSDGFPTGLGFKKFFHTAYF